MPALRELQERFCAAMFADGAAVLPGDLDGAPEAADRGLVAYRRSVLGNLGAALLATYPVVAQIVGLPFFREAARQYVLATPSLSGDLNEYGGGFPEFLAEYPHAASLPYLPDVARLEWRVQAVFYAAEAPAADLTPLHSIAPERYGDVRFVLSAAHARFDSPWPLGQIRRHSQPGRDGDEAVDFSAGCRLLILRRDGLVRVDELGPGEAGFIDALAAGETLGAATARGLATEAEFDPAAALRRLATADLLLGASLAAAT